MSGERIQIPLKAGHHRPASETPFKWPAGRWWPYIECWLGSFVIFQGSRTSIAKEPYSFVNLRERGVGTHFPPPPLDPLMYWQFDIHGSSLNACETSSVNFYVTLNSSHFSDQWAPNKCKGVNTIDLHTSRAVSWFFDNTMQLKFSLFQCYVEVMIRYLCQMKISAFIKLDQPISVWRVVGWHFSFLFNF